MGSNTGAVCLDCSTRSLVVSVTYYLLLVPLSIYLHDRLCNDWGLISAQRIDEYRATREEHGATTNLHPIGLAVYACWLLAWRLWHIRRAYVLYEYCWLCNFTIVASGIAISSVRPWLALAYCSVVAVDQFLWYVDLTYYLAARTCNSFFQERRDGRFTKKRFLVGVCQYVFDEQTSWTTRITCTHHLWTIPLVIWHLVHDENLSSLLRLHFSQHTIWGAWRFLSLLSFVFMTLHVAWSRLFIPLHDPETRKYLNVNLGHDLWKDVTIPWLQIHDANALKYLSRLLLRWQLLNMMFGFVFVAYAQQATTTRIR